MKRWTFATIAVLFILLPWRQALRADQVQYTVEDLGTIDGLVPTVTGLNASGQVSGFVTLPGDGTQTRAVRYTNGLGWTYLPGLDAPSAAYGINAYGDLTGSHTSASGATLAYRYTDAGGVQDIGPMPDGNFTVGRAINATGDVVGYGDASGLLVAFRASPLLSPQTLPSLGGSFAIACSINDAGQVAGSAMTPEGFQHAIRIDTDGSVVDAGTFDGPAGDSSGCAIDGDGRFGGQSTRSGPYRAFRFFGGTLLDLDSFGSSFSKVEGMASGASVGWYLPADGSPARPFIHTDANGSIDLNTLIAADTGWVLGQAKAINASGQIAGEGTLNGAPGAFRLTLAAVADTTPPVIDRVTATPSRVWPPNGEMVPVTVTVSAVDDVDAAPACALTAITSRASVADDAVITGPMSALLRAVGGRTYVLTVTCTDAAGNSSAATANVVVPPDTTAPVIGLLVATPSHIWPPNGRMVDVELTVGATDDVDASPACSLTAVRGMRSGDSEITGPLSARVRAKKNDDGSERSYLLTVTCTDSAGNSARRSVTVTVSKGESDDYARLYWKSGGRHSRLYDRDDRDDDHGRSGKSGKGRR